VPLYEYICPVCGNTIEEIKPMSRMDELPCCKKCVFEVMVRVISPSNFVINGYSEKNGYSKPKGE
jgi:putative FmdB family regulatory protein